MCISGPSGDREGLKQPVSYTHEATEADETLELQQGPGGGSQTAVPTNANACGASAGEIYRGSAAAQRAVGFFFGGKNRGVSLQSRSLDRTGVTVITPAACLLSIALFFLPCS